MVSFHPENTELVIFTLKNYIINNALQFLHYSTTVQNKCSRLL